MLLGSVAVASLNENNFSTFQTTYHFHFALFVVSSSRSGLGDSEKSSFVIIVYSSLLILFFYEKIILLKSSSPWLLTLGVWCPLSKLGVSGLPLPKSLSAVVVVSVLSWAMAQSLLLGVSELPPPTSFSFSFVSGEALSLIFDPNFALLEAFIFFEDSLSCCFFESYVGSARIIGLRNRSWPLLSPRSSFLADRQSLGPNSCSTCYNRRTRYKPSRSPIFSQTRAKTLGRNRPFLWLLQGVCE